MIPHALRHCRSRTTALRLQALREEDAPMRHALPQAGRERVPQEGQRQLGPFHVLRQEEEDVGGSFAVVEAALPVLGGAAPFLCLSLFLFEAAWERWLNGNLGVVTGPFEGNCTILRFKK